MVRTALRSIVTEAYSAFLGTLTASGDLGALDSIPYAWAQFVTDDVGEVLGATFLEGGLSAFTDASSAFAIPNTLVTSWTGVMNDTALDYMRGATNRLTGVGQALWQDIRNATVQSLQAGASVEDLKGEVERLTGFSELRADTIARTETVGAYVNGHRDGAEGLGSYGPVEHVWRATHDRRTRPSHAEADGQVRPFGEPFDVGGEAMMHPHDSSAPAGEVVNCRCVEDHLYAGDRRPDGSTVGE